jgi:hypothetical protein
MQCRSGLYGGCGYLAGILALVRALAALRGGAALFGPVLHNNDSRPDYVDRFRGIPLVEARYVPDRAIDSVINRVNMISPR